MGKKAKGVPFVFGNDPIDKFSQPVKIVDAMGLGKVFLMPERRNEAKPGRALRVMFDQRGPLPEVMHVSYCYTVSFDDAGNWAGNHYHQVKMELFITVHGKINVHLYDPHTKEQVVVALSSKRPEILFVDTGVAHKVIAKTDGAVLLVLANSPGIQADDFPCEIP